MKDNMIIPIISQGDINLRIIFLFEKGDRLNINSSGNMRERRADRVYMCTLVQQLMLEMSRRRYVDWFAEGSGRGSLPEDETPALQHLIWDEERLALGLVNPQHSSPSTQMNKDRGTRGILETGSLSVCACVCVSSHRLQFSLLHAGMSSVIIKRGLGLEPRSACLLLVQAVS